MYLVMWHVDGVRLLTPGHNFGALGISNQKWVAHTIDFQQICDCYWPKLDKWLSLRYIWCSCTAWLDEQHGRSYKHPWNGAPDPLMPAYLAKQPLRGTYESHSREYLLIIPWSLVRSCSKLPHILKKKNHGSKYKPSWMVYLHSAA